MGVYGQEDGFQSFDPAFISGVGEDAAHRAWRRRVGVDLCSPFAKWGCAHYVFKTAGRIASGEAVPHGQAAGLQAVLIDPEGELSLQASGC